MLGRTLFLTSLFCTFILASSAQKQNNIWAFGGGYGLDFTSGGPSYFTNSMSTVEGCAAVSDKCGNLLFYSDWSKVYDRTHAVMPNGSSMKGNSSATQGVAIAKIRGDDSLYFIFHLGHLFKIGPPSLVPSGALRYSIVNMNLNGGKGDIVSASKSTFVMDSLSEKMIIADAGKYQWLITHHIDSAIFYAFKLDTGKALSTPVVSRVGNANGVRAYMAGEMKISPDYKKLALTSSSFRAYGVETYDFDPATGVVTNCSALDSTLGIYPYSCEFSMDGQKLYVQEISSGINQYNLTAGSSSAIKSSRYTLPTDAVAFRMGPDSMIYVLTSTTPTNFSRIRNPNNSGVSCNYQVNFLSPSFGSTGKLANTFGNQFVPLSFDTLFGNKNHTLCFGEKIKVVSSGLKEFQWNDGDTASFKISPSTTATYWVKSLNKYCDVIIDTFRITESSSLVTSLKDTLVCPKAKINLSGRVASDSFLWYDGTKAMTKTLLALGGKYWVVSFKGCVKTIDTFRIIENPINIITNKHNINQCNGSFTVLIGISGMDNYQWNTRDTNATLKVSSSGKYWVESVKDCKLYVDTFNLNLMPYSTTNMEHDTTICFKTTATIMGPSSFDTYLWNSGSTKKDTSLFTSAKVSVVATNHTTCQILNKSYNVKFVSFITMSRDTFTCNQDTIILDATVNVPNATYRWKTGETASSVKVNKPCTRIVFVSVLGCTATDTFEVANKNIPIDIGEDQIVCEGQKITLSANIDDVQYQWSTGEKTKAIEVDKTGVYSISVSKNDCFASDEVKIYFDNCDHCVAFPNAFTPNDDGINDFFKPILHCNTSSFEFVIFNRWGQEIFSSNSPNQKWDGRWMGNMLENGVYFYLLKVKFAAQDEIEKMYKGEVTLIR